jgi:hypothetical protein
VVVEFIRRQPGGPAIASDIDAHARYLDERPGPVQPNTCCTIARTSSPIDATRETLRRTGCTALRSSDSSGHRLSGRWSTAIRDGLRALHTTGHLAPDINPDDLAVTLLAALQGGLLLAQVQRDTRPLQTTLDTLFALASAT